MPKKEEQFERRVSSENYVLVGVAYALGLIAIGAGTLFAYRSFRKTDGPPIAAGDPAGGAGVGLPGAGLGGFNDAGGGAAGGRAPAKGRPAAQPVAAPAVDPGLPSPRNRRNPKVNISDFNKPYQKWNMNRPEYGFYTLWPIKDGVPDSTGNVRQDALKKFYCSLDKYQIPTGDSTVCFEATADVLLTLSYAEYAEIAGDPGEFVDANYGLLHTNYLKRRVGDNPLPPPGNTSKVFFLHDGAVFGMTIISPNSKCFYYAFVARNRLYMLHVMGPTKLQDANLSLLQFFDSFGLPDTR
jgi:hypothetical protein